jgi:hypothetical protein
MKYLSSILGGAAAFWLSLCFLCHAADQAAAPGDFSFVQMSDIHWGFNNPAVNPDGAASLNKAIDAINRLRPQPDFVMVTGDLTESTSDPQERRQRLAEFRRMISRLDVKDVRFIPGENDAALDQGEAYKEFFGDTYYAFEHKGVHFIAIDNASDQTSSIGEAQLQWLEDELKKLDQDAKIVVFTHRPLFNQYPAWDWWTRDGAKALALLKPYKNVFVFYGHVHRESDLKDGNISFHAAPSVMYIFRTPESTRTRRAPALWSSAQPYKGLGFRSVLVKAGTGELVVTEHPVGAEAGVIGEKDPVKNTN